ncbi:MAG: nickel/cobalt transporter [Pseudomonadota bacterium]
MKASSTEVQSSPFDLIVKLALLALFVGLLVLVISQWNAFVVTTVQWQKSLHSMLASHMSAVSENPFQYGGALILLSFAYGVFHAVGPGHGKAVIMTYLGTNKESLSRGIAISFFAALLQSLVAIALVSVLAKLLSFKLADVQAYGDDVALASYVLVILLGFMLLFKATRQLLNLRRLRDRDARDHPHHDSHDHHHAHDCGCSHAHAPDQNQSLLQTIAVVISMGIRPCSGAIVVLIYAHLVGVFGYGVAATLLMGLGTGLSISLLAVATLYARSWVENFASESILLNANTHRSAASYIRLIGGGVLVALGWSLFTAASVVSSGNPLL